MKVWLCSVCGNFNPLRYGECVRCHKQCDENDQYLVGSKVVKKKVR